MTEKILYIINHMDWFWSHRLPLAIAAQKDGYEVLICAPDADKDDELAQYGFRGFALNKIYGPVCVWRAVQKIRKIIELERPELLHGITLKFAFPAGLAARGLNINIVHTIAGLGYLFAGDGWKPKLLRMVLGPFLKRAFVTRHTKIIFQNPDDLALMIRRGFADKDGAHLIRGSGVDVQQFKFSELPKAETPMVLFPTRLVWEKGVKVFIDAANLLQQKGVIARYAIAGGIKKNTPSAIKQHEMEEILKGSPVEWLGHVDHMPQLLEKSTIIAYPSWYGEGVPKVLLEAAACGRPIVTTDHPGCREVVSQGKNGLLVPVKDALAFASAIEDILSDKARLKEMGAQSRHIAERDFDVKIVVQKTLDVYRSFSGHREE